MNELLILKTYYYYDLNFLHYVHGYLYLELNQRSHNIMITNRPLFIFLLDSELKPFSRSSLSA